MLNSPYDNLNVDEWYDKTKELVNSHPLSTEEIVDTVFSAWDGILQTKIANELQIGVDIFPSPQILGNYLHELIPVILSKKHPNEWRKEIDKIDKDLVYIPDTDYSVEIKTSSSANNIYGNRSYGQKNSENNSGKSKSGFYLAINFEKFKPKQPKFVPYIRKIRFGWIDHSDWHAQAASTGQQAYLEKDAKEYKLLTLYDINNQ